MRLLKRATAIVGAMALAGSMSLGLAAQSYAVVQPTVAITNGTAGAVFSPNVDYSVAGCSVADGAEEILLTVVDSESSEPVEELTVPAPATGAATGQFYLDAAAFYELNVSCTRPADDPVDAELTYFDLRNGQLTVTPQPVLAGGTVTVASTTGATIQGSTIDSFGPNAEVTVTIDGPDDSVEAIVIADENGKATWSGLLASPGVYQVSFRGDKPGVNVPQDLAAELTGSFEVADTPDDPGLDDPIVEITNDDENGIVSDGVVTAEITGCTAAEGVAEARVYLHSYALDAGLDDVTIFEGGIPETGAVVNFNLPQVPGQYAVDVACFLAADDDDTDWAGYGYADFSSNSGVLLVEPPQWTTGDPVTVLSATLELYGDDDTVTATADAFDPNSQVHLVVTGPDGTIHDLGMFTTDANGKLVALDVVLPYTVDGVYTITATGVLGDLEVTLTTSYQRVTPPAPPADKPTALPRTGTDGLDLVGTAALITIAVGAAAVASRRH